MVKGLEGWSKNTLEMLGDRWQVPDIGQRRSGEYERADEKRGGSQYSQVGGAWKPSGQD